MCELLIEQCCMFVLINDDADLFNKADVTSLHFNYHDNTRYSFAFMSILGRQQSVPFLARKEVNAKYL